MRIGTHLACLGALTVVLGLTVFGCDDSGGGGGGGGGSGSIAFHGEQEALPGFSYDTGFQPEDSPIQVRLLLESTGGLTADATAESDGSTMTADASSGQFALDAHIQIQALLRVEVPGIDPYEGPIEGAPDIEIAFGAESGFTPFLEGESVSLTADVPQTQLAVIPLAATLPVPGLTGDLIIDASGTINSSFSGVCAEAGGPETAMYQGETTTNGELLIIPSVHIEVPFVLDETLEGIDIPIEISDIVAEMALAPSEAPAGYTATGGGSSVDTNGCGGGGDGDGDGDADGDGDGDADGDGDGDADGDGDGDADGDADGDGDVYDYCEDGEDCREELICLGGLCREDNGETCETVDDVIMNRGCNAGRMCDVVSLEGHIACIDEGSGEHYEACADDGCEIGSGCFSIGEDDEVGTCTPYCDIEGEIDDCPGTGLCLSSYTTLDGELGLCILPDDCDPVDDSGCDASEMCTLLTIDGASICFELGTVGPGGDCSAAYCASGLVCDTFYYSDYICRELCWDTGDCSSGSCNTDALMTDFGICLE